MSTTFAVSNVKIEQHPLEEMPAGEVLQAYAGGEPCEATGFSKAKLVAVTPGDNDWRPPPMHPFLLAVHRAFADHRPLSISPDHIWLLVTQGFAEHLKQNAETLRPQFVQHEGKTTLQIQRDSFRKGSPDNDWQGAFGEFSEQLKDHIGKKQDLLVGDFSTTGIVEKACSEVVLMDAMSEYFDYQVYTFCGIPSITLEGAPEDWMSIRQRAAVFSEFELSWWIDGLLPILDQFVAAATGKIEKNFWRSLYKWNDESGGPTVTGWIHTLFPYINGHVQNEHGEPDWDKDKQPVPNSYASSSWQHIGYGGGHRPSDFPPHGLSVVDFEWSYLNQEFEMEFLAGFVGVSQDGVTLRPEVGWGVREAAR